MLYRNLLLTIAVLFGFQQTKAQGLTGPGNTCPRTVGYSVINGPECGGRGLTSAWVTGGGSVISYGSRNINVQWNLPGTYILYATYEYRSEITTIDLNGNIVRECGPTRTSFLSRSITVFNEIVGTPSTVTHDITDLYPRKYIFKTSATGANRYRWEVNNGGIYGCTTCNEIQVVAYEGACFVSGTVRAESPCGRLSEPVSFYRQIHPPSKPSPIQGPTYVGAYGDFKLYTVNKSSNVTSYRWYFAPGSQFLGHSISNQISVACNTNATTASTLYVVAKNSCAESSVRARTLTGGINPPYRSSVDNGFKKIEKSAIVQEGADQSAYRLLIPDYEKAKEVSIYSITGRKVRSINQVDIDNELLIKGLDKGLYIAVINKSEETEKVKFIVK